MSIALLDSRCVFVVAAQTQEEVFEEVSARLEGMGYVKPGFKASLMDREREYPTGIDASPLGSGFPSFAVPHTNPEYVNVSRIVPIKISSHVEWRDMIDLDHKLEINFAFMILNGDGGAQADILALIMDTVNRLGKEGVAHLCSLEDEAEIYRELSPFFNVR